MTLTLDPLYTTKHKSSIRSSILSLSLDAILLPLQVYLGLGFINRPKCLSSAVVFRCRIILNDRNLWA